MSGAGHLFDQMASILLVLTLMLAAIYAAIFVLDPFRSAAVAQRPTLTPTIARTPGPTRPATWTPTATPGPSLTPTITGTPGPTRTPLPTLTPTPTDTPIGPTFSPFKYTKTDEEVVFVADVYGAACGTWMGVAGVTLGVDGAPLPGVTIAGWGGPIPEQDKRLFVSGSSERLNRLYGSPAAYEVYIGAPGDFEFMIQVYENGQPVSEIVKLQMRSDCRGDRAVLNIQRNH